MTEVVSIKFKSGGKNYYFDPAGRKIETGEKLIVETSNGLEMAECTRGNHSVEDDALIRPLRPVVRIATEKDRQAEQQNRQKEKDALVICRKKIEEHGLEMKLVDVECSFDGSKTLFFFTADGRVDFRELVKDLAGIFHNRIELRQIGVRDEAKMVGGIGICGRPYCCGEFLEDFAPVSTKMAKVQSLSLNPAKISGSCGRLMCCLRYEEEAYEELVKTVPKQGAFVETVDGYGTAVQVNLLRQTVKVHIDGESDDAFHVYKANELAAVPGGRPKDGEKPPKVLNYVPEEIEEEPEEDPWSTPALFAEEVTSEPEASAADAESAEVPSQEKSGRRSHRRGRRKPGAKPDGAAKPQKTEQPAKPAKPEKQAKPEAGKSAEGAKQQKPEKQNKPEKTAENGDKPAQQKKKSGFRRHRYYGNKKKNTAPKSE